MSESPFKIIRSTDEPPPSLRKDVVSSVKFVMLLMRFLQLFVVDATQVLFENVRKTGTSSTPPTPDRHGSGPPEG